MLPRAAQISRRARQRPGRADSGPPREGARSPGHPLSRGISSRRPMLFPAALLVLVAIVPWLTEFYEHGDWPRQARALTTEVTVSGLTLLLGGWIVTLIRR